MFIISDIINEYILKWRKASIDIIINFIKILDVLIIVHLFVLSNAISALVNGPSR